MEQPEYEVLTVSPVSVYDFPSYSRAFVKAKRDFVIDYSTIRNRSLVRVYYARCMFSETEFPTPFSLTKPIVEIRQKSRLVDFRRAPDDERILFQVWGFREIVRPGKAPKSAEASDFELTWPGHTQSLNYERAHHLRPWDVAYVSDEVLGHYEGRPEFQVFPETGGVSHGNQWSVSWTSRVGRDLIRLELKKLYEGNRSETIELWHSYAVDPPSAEPDEEENIATRSRRVAYALAEIGALLSTLDGSVSCDNFIGFDKAGLDYAGWWTVAAVETASRHIPKNLTKDDFLRRCSDLYQLVGESLAQKHLRRLVESLGVDPKEVEEYRSLRLLDRIVRIAQASAASGLGIKAGNPLLDQVDKSGDTAVATLFGLNALRQSSDHLSSATKNGVNQALSTFGMTIGGIGSNWGRAVDQVYDRVGDALEQICESLAAAQP